MNKLSSLLVFLLALSLSVASCSKDSDSDEDITQYTNRLNKEKGERFLMENRDADGVIEMPSGLQYKVDTLGTGVKPSVLDTVLMTYKGTLVNGTTFSGATAKMTIESQIEGMREGLQLMPEGSVFDLYIPYYMAYGNESQNVMYNNNIVTIAAYSMLHFRVKIEKVYPYLDYTD